MAGWAHTRLDPFYHRFTIRGETPRWSVLREQVRIGIPMGLSYALEATSFTFITLMVARLGTSVMAGHQIVANLAALCFMVPLSLAVATATLTAHAIGAEDAGRARRTAATGIRIALIAGAALALAVWTLRHAIVRLYTSDAAVAAVALTLVPFLATFHVFDALQTAVGFVLRAHKRAVAPTVAYALALWGVGLFGGYHVAFRGLWGPPWGVTGMWLMQSIGLGLAGVLLLAFYIWLLRERTRARRMREEHDGRKERAAMPHALPQEIKQLVDRPNFAHLATLMPDGSPQSVPVWVGRDGDRILVCTGEGSLKARNTRRDPRVALSIVDFHDPYMEAQIRGRVVERRPDPDLAIMDPVSHKYTGKPFPMRNPEGRVALVIEVEKARYVKLPFEHTPPRSA